VILEANAESGTGGPLNFKFSAPQAVANVGYVLSFCIGPASDPCASPTTRVVNVPGGQEKSEVIDASVFKNNVLTVGQGTKTDIPFVVTIG
jgi:hypothetical protein